MQKTIPLIILEYRLIYYWLNHRIFEHKIQCWSQIPWISGENRTNVATSLFFSEAMHFFLIFTTYTCNRTELFHLWHGRRFLFFTNSSNVCDMYDVWYHRKLIFSVCAFERMPFSWKTPLGYLITLSFEFFGGCFGTISLCAFFPLLIGSCLLFKTFVEDITSDLHPLNVDHKRTWNGDHAKNMKMILCSVVQHHSDLTQLSIF